MSKIEKFIQEYNFDKNIIFDWSPGVWKTHTMKLLFEKLPRNEDEKKYVKYWIDDWEMKEFINSWQMVLRWLEDNTKNFLKYPLEMCIRAEILFFDDIWSSWNVSDAQKTKLKYILDEREKKWLVTIMSTNLSPKEIETRYWERIKSRIYNWKSKKWLMLINISWQDKRKENIQTLDL